MTISRARQLARDQQALKSSFAPVTSSRQPTDAERLDEFYRQEILTHLAEIERHKKAIVRLAQLRRLSA